METTIIYWGNLEVMEKKMETTIVLYIVGFEVWGLGFRGMEFKGLGFRVAPRTANHRSPL